MADAQKINPNETLRTSYPKINQAIENSNQAKKDSEEALQTANEAKFKADSTKTELDQIVIEGDSSVEAAQARVDADGNPHTTLKERLDFEHNQLSSQLAQTELEIEKTDAKKADKAYVDNALDTKVDKNGVAQITWAMAAQDFREQITGGNTAVVGVNSVSTENVVNKSITAAKRTVLGELGLVTCDNGSYVNFDFEQGMIEFVKNVTFELGTPRIRVHYRNSAIEIGEDLSNVSITFNNNLQTRTALTFNVVTGALKTYVQSELSSMSEDEVLIAVWIGNDKHSVQSNINHLRINGKPVKDTTFSNLDDDLFNVLMKNKLTDVISVKGRAILEPGKYYRLRSSEDRWLNSRIEGKNVFWGYRNQYISNGQIIDYPDDRRRTTTFINVSEGIPLTISGSGVNRREWAFLDADGNPIKFEVDKSTVVAPQGSMYAICYYYNASTDTPPEGDQVQIEVGYEATAYEEPYRKAITSNNKVFKVEENETISCLFREEIEVYDINQNEDVGSKIYGVRYKVDQSDPKVERVGAAVGLRAEISVDNQPAVNDFDTIYPWSEMKLCNVLKTEWGATKITYEGEDGFSLDGSNGDVMVEIPKHYVRRYRENGYEYVLISGTPQDGFAVDPSFVEKGKELDKIYVARYNSSYDGDVPYSRTGEYPRGSKGLRMLLTEAEAKGDGYSILDFRTLSTIQRLFLVEFATRNSQEVMGGITMTVYHGKSDCLALESETNTNKIKIQQGEQSDKFRVGQRCSVAAEQEYQDRHIIAINDLPNNEREIVFDGDPVDVIAGETYIYNIPQENGDTDYITYSSGRKAGDNDKVAFTYRGIENIYGNIHEIIAGAYAVNGVVHLLENMADYNVEDYESISKKLSFKLPNVPYTGDYNATSPYIKQMGFDPLNPLAILPEIAGTETVGEDYWCDEINANYDDKVNYCAFGGGWDHYQRSGLFNYRFFLDRDLTYPGWLYGSRLIYKPI